MSQAADLNKMTVVQLKEELTKKNLDTAGKKAELVDRLLTHPTTDASTVKAENGESATTESSNSPSKETKPTVTDIKAEVSAEEVTPVKEDQDTQKEEASDADAAEEKMSTENTATENTDSAEAEEVKESVETDAEKAAEDEEKSEVETAAKPEGADVEKKEIPFKCKFKGMDKEELIKVHNDSLKVKQVTVSQLTLADLSLSSIKDSISSCTDFTVRFQNGAKKLNEATAWNGVLHMDFKTRGDAVKAVESLKALDNHLSVEHKPNPSARNTARPIPALAMEQILFIPSIPDAVDEYKLQTEFPESNQIVLPYQEDKRVG